jgi:serine/threonine-protein kinase
MPFLGGTSSGSRGSTQLQTSDGLSGLLTEIRNKFGDTMGYTLAVYPDYAVIERVDPQQNHNRRTYTYKGGGWIDVNMSTPSGDLDSLVDLGKFDPAAVAARLASAAKTLNVSNATSTYLVISGSGSTPGSADISIHVSGNGEGYMEINPDGSVKQLHPQS